MLAETPAWLDRALFPFAPQRIAVDGHDVAYVDEGDGPVLLMVHGNPTWSFVWRELIAGLRDRFRCVALDLPGFGLSHAASGYGFRVAEHAEVVAGFVDALDLRDATLVAQDWGGPIGLSVAAAAPERFGALVLANTFAWPVNGDLHFEAFSRLMGGPVGREAILRANAFVRLLVPAGTKRVGPSPAVMDHYRGPFPTRDSRVPTAVLPHEIRAARPFLTQLEQDLERLRDLPLLLLWGDGDIAFRARERERFEALFPTHRTVVLEGAGHFVQEDAADAMVAAIRGWDALA